MANFRTAPVAPTGPGLRLLATSDLHMALHGFDYIADHPTKGSSLARLAPLIRTARAEAVTRGHACVLMDNGDLLQGTPMADCVAAARPGMPHPAIACLAALEYDAVGLGNHDLDYGLPFLASVAAQMPMPLLCANLHGTELPGVQPGLLLTRHLADETGAVHPLRIGILSVLPPDTVLWNCQNLAGRVTATPEDEALARVIPDMRRQGADLIVVLAHTGIGAPDGRDSAEQAALRIAALPGVDAIIAGHTHRRFPGPDHAGIAGADGARGTLQGIPAAMPGAHGSDLAVIDLDLTRTGGKWRVTGHRSTLRSPPKDAAEDPALTTILTPAHQQTRAAVNQPVAHLQAPMHSFFSLVRPGAVTALVGEAKMAAIRDAVTGTPFADLPLLAAVSSPMSGGQAGPGYYVDLPGGEIRQRHLAALSPFSNQIWGLRMTGADLHRWLERSACIFNHLRPGNPAQPLINTSVPSFRFDTIHGLDYRIDPTRPAPFDATGAWIVGAPGRISHVTWQGRAVAPDQPFLLATTHYRVGGGGGYGRFDTESHLVRTQITLREALQTYLAAPDCAAVRSARFWQFAPDLGVCALFHTAPEAATRLAELADMTPEPLGHTPEGFLSLRLTL